MHALPLPVLVSLAVLALAPAAPAAEVTRTLSAELSGDAHGAFAVENLAGSMRVVAGSADRVRVTGTVHAESDELAGSLKIVQVSGEKGVPTLRVRYPYDRHRTYRYLDTGSAHPDSEADHGFAWLARLFGVGGTETRYDGERVRVARDGVLLYADLLVEVPPSALDATFRTVVGPLDGQGVQGRLTFDTGTGRITLTKVGGTVKADTGSGDVRATDLSGSFNCDTGSGDCRVSGFQGDELKADTGSGAVRIDGARARRVAVDTGSGDVRVQVADAEEFAADTGSGGVQAELPGKALARVKADTGSGAVVLRMDPGAGFEAHADVGSGNIVSRYADAQPILHDREVIGYRRGDGRVRIDVDTGSGDVVLEPVR